MKAGAAVSGAVGRLGAPAFARIHRYDRALRRKLTPAGWLVAALLVASAVFGLDTRESLIHQLFGLALALLAVAAVASWRWRFPARVRRSLPSRATAGVAFEYTLEIEHHGAREARGLRIEDVVHAEGTAARAFAAFKVRADEQRNVVDRWIGYPRWVDFVRWRAGVRIDAQDLAPLPARATTAVRMRCLPLRRGIVAFREVRVGRREPLGLMRASWRAPLAESLVVLPRTWPVASLPLAGSRRLQPGGIAFAGRIGDAEEFVGLRDYRAGDSPRRIHWKAWARTGTPVVKEYEEEFFVRQALILDTFGPEGEAFEAAVSLAASLVVAPRSGEELLDLVFVEGRAYAMTLGRGVGTAPELLRVLAAVQPARAGFEALAAAVALAAPRLSSAVCVFLAWDAARQRLVAALRARGLPVRVWLLDAGAGAVAAGPMAADPANFRVVAPARVAEALAKP